MSPCLVKFPCFFPLLIQHSCLLYHEDTMDTHPLHGSLLTILRNRATEAHDSISRSDEDVAICPKPISAIRFLQITFLHREFLKNHQPVRNQLKVQIRNWFSNWCVYITCIVLTIFAHHFHRASPSKFYWWKQEESPPLKSKMPCWASAVEKEQFTASSCTSGKVDQIQHSLSTAVLCL